MGRAIGSAVIGYIVIFLVVFTGLTVIWMIMGADTAFRTGTFNVSTAFVVAMLLVGIVAALAGGYVCSLLGRQGRAVMILAGIVLVLGLVQVVADMTAERGALEAVRLGDVGMFEAMGKARSPVWLSVVKVVVGVSGVMIGSRLHGGSSA